MPKCVIEGCPNTPHKLMKKPGITFHGFPLKLEKMIKWIEAIRIQNCDKNWAPSQGSIICSDHFLKKHIHRTPSGLQRLHSEALPVFTKSNDNLTQKENPSPPLVDGNMDYNNFITNQEPFYITLVSSSPIPHTSIVSFPQNIDPEPMDVCPEEIEPETEQSLNRCLSPLSISGSIVQENLRQPLPVEEVIITEEEPSIMMYNIQTGNVERIVKTYPKTNLPIASKPQRPNDKGIRLKNSRDLLWQPTVKQTSDRIKEISSQLQAKGQMLDIAHLGVVMGQIQNTLESMSRDELISFCKIKIEEEIMGKAEKIERDKRISNLEASLLACQGELTVLNAKNKELKYAITTIYGEYKKETTHKAQPPQTQFNDFMPELTIPPSKPPIVPVQLNKHPLDFILPDNPPEDNNEFITCDVKTEYPEVPIVPLNLDDMPEILAEKGEDLPCAQNRVPPPNSNPTRYLVISPSHNPTPLPLAAIINDHQQSTSTNTTTTNTVSYSNTPEEGSQIANEIDIEDRIPHALITCKSVQTLPAAFTSTCSKKNKVVAPSNNVEVFKVLQSIDLTHEQRISKQKVMKKTTSNDMNNCFPRIVSTQSLAPQLKVGSVSVKPLDDLTANSNPLTLSNNESVSVKPIDDLTANSNPLTLTNNENPAIQNSSQLLIPSSYSSNLLNSNGQMILNGANPMQIAYIVNGMPGSQGPQQVYFTFQSPNLQGGAMLRPQTNGPLFITQTGSSVSSETGPMMTPTISDVTSLGKPVRGAIKYTNSVATETLQQVFDLTDDEPNNAPNNNFENTSRLVCQNVSEPGMSGDSVETKLEEVKKRIRSSYLSVQNVKRATPAQLRKFIEMDSLQPHQLDKIAIVQISPEDRRAADSKIESLRMSSCKGMKYMGYIKKISLEKKHFKFSGSAPATLIKKFT